MTDYPDVPEDVSEINPEHVSESQRFEVLLREPGSYRKNDDGTETWLVPSPWMLLWNQIPLIVFTENCQHAFSACSECGDQWEIDHYVRMFEGRELIYLSPDHPDNKGF
jgi:hypothetical protein